MEGMSDPRLGRADDPAFVLLVAVGFYLVHARAGKHSFRACDRAATRANVDGPDGARRFIYKRDNPDGLSALIRAQRVTYGREARLRYFRGVARYRERARGIEIQLRRVNGRSFGRASNRSKLSSIRNDAAISNLDLTHTAPAARVLQNDFPPVRLRIAFDTDDRDNMAKGVTP